MEKLHCPNCGKHTAKCSITLADGAEYYDRYTLECSSCGHKKEIAEKAGSPFYGGEEPPTICPFCGNDCHSHYRKPEKREDE